MIGERAVVLTLFLAFVLGLWLLAWASLRIFTVQILDRLSGRCDAALADIDPESDWSTP